MIKCPYCAEEIQDAAIKCKHCGEVLDKNKSQNEVDKVEVENPLSYSRLFRALGAPGVIALVVVLVITIHTLSCSKPSTPENKPDVPDNVNICVEAMEYVKDRLKSPGSAKFPDCWAQSITALGDNKWQVRSYVDSQNGFGALLRSNYTIVVKYLGNGNFSIDEVKEFSDGGQQ